MVTATIAAVVLGSILTALARIKPVDPVDLAYADVIDALGPATARVFEGGLR